MNKDLKVGDVVFIREDLEQYTIYGNQSWVNAMKTGKVVISYVDCEGFHITTDTEHKGMFSYTYTPEMIDWDKTNEYRKSSKNYEDSPFNELENGDIVYIRDDLENEREYGSNTFMAKYMLVGAQKVRDINFELNNFTLVDNKGDYIYFYTPEMIDWDKTRVLNQIGRAHV